MASWASAWTVCDVDGKCDFIWHFLEYYACVLVFHADDICVSHIHINVYTVDCIYVYMYVCVKCQLVVVQLYYACLHALAYLFHACGMSVVMHFILTFLRRIVVMLLLDEAWRSCSRASGIL